jgi:hypothetical protein
LPLDQGARRRIAAESPPVAPPLCLRTRKRNLIEPDANSQAKSGYVGSVENRLKFAKLLFVQ